MTSQAEEEFEWDSTEKVEWSDSFRIVDIPSSKDSTIQPAYFGNHVGRASAADRQPAYMEREAIARKTL